MIYYVIPARKGSKGFPDKNRLLFDIIAKTLKSVYKDVIVTTDDEFLIDRAYDYEFKVRIRPKEFAQDNTAIKTVYHDVINYFEMKPEDIIVGLYLTYPERTWNDICDGLNFFYTNKAKSMLCKKEWQGVHPCLCMWDMGKNKGKQLFYHTYYRRQDYPTVFEISHFLAIFRVEEFSKLNNQLYNDDTIFMPIYNKIDVDYFRDYEQFQQKYQITVDSK